MVLNIARIIIFTIGILVIFDIWGAPTLPIIIALFASLFIVLFAFRNTFDNFLAGLEIAFGEHIKVGHLIELESGEAGYLMQISWTRTIIQTSEGNLVIIPNYKLMANIIVNRGTAADGTTVTNIQTTATAINPARPLDILSDREWELLSLIGKGSTNREIAQKLFISEHTVKSHIRSILSKLNIRNRQQAAAYAEREGLNSGIIRQKKNS